MLQKAKGGAIFACDLLPPKPRAGMGACIGGERLACSIAKCADPATKYSTCPSGGVRPCATRAGRATACREGIGAPFCCATRRSQDDSVDTLEQSTRPMLPRPGGRPHSAAAYALAVATLVAAVGLRYVLDPWMRDSLRSSRFSAPSLRPSGSVATVCRHGCPAIDRGLRDASA